MPCHILRSRCTKPQVTSGSSTGRYSEWVSENFAPLERFINRSADPRNFYIDLEETAGGASGRPLFLASRSAEFRNVV